MGTASAFQSGFSAGMGRQDRRHQDQAEQRNMELQAALQNATTPQEQQAVIHDAYAKDPNHVKQFVENLARRATGKQPQQAPSPYAAPSVTTQTGGVTDPNTGQSVGAQPLTVQGPAPKTRQEAFAGHAARGKLPAQQDAEAGQAKLASGNNAKLDLDAKQTQQEQQSAIDLIKKYVPQEQQQEALADYARKQTGTNTGVKNLPGAAGQPYKNADGKWVRPVQGTDGSISEQPMPAAYAGPQAKPQKPVFKVIRGQEVLLDPTSGAVMKVIGPVGTSRTTSRQSLQYDNDGKPHMVTLTTVSTPGGGSIEVDTAPDSQPKGPAPKKQASAKPAQTPKPDQLNFSRSTPQSTAAKKSVDTAENAYRDVQKASADPTPVGDQGVILAWLRGRVNRVTNNEIKAVNNLGGAEMKLEGNLVRIASGKMTDQQRQWFLKSAKDNYENAKQVASKYDAPAPQAGGKASGGNIIVVKPEDMK